MDSFAIELFRQSIFKRDNTLFGSEMQTHGLGQACGALSSPLMNAIQREFIRSQFTDTFSTEQLLPSVPATLDRKFVAIGRHNLLDITLIEDIIPAHDTAQGHNQKPVISIDERSLTDATAIEKTTLIKHIYLLKDSGIEIAFTGYNLIEGSTETLSTLNAFNYLKVDLQKNKLNEQLHASPELLNRLYDQMNIMAHTQKVRFIAERIEHQHHHVLARSLPFDFFQGDYYSLPKALTNKGYTSP